MHERDSLTRAWLVDAASHSARPRRQPLHGRRRRQGARPARSICTSAICRSTTTAKRCVHRPASAPPSTKTSKKRTELRKTEVSSSSFCSFEPHLELGQKRQVVRRHQRFSRPRDFDAGDLDLAFVVDVIEVQERKDPGYVRLRRRCVLRSMASSFFVSAAVASPPLHSLKSPSRIFGGAMRPSCTMAARRSAWSLRSRYAVPRCTLNRCSVLSSMRMSARWQQRGSHVRQDRSYWTCWRIGIVRQHHVAELMTAQMAHRRHHPAHAERRADFLGMTRVVRARADDFLQRDDVGIQAGEHVNRALRHRAPVHAAAAMDVVGDDSKRFAYANSRSVEVEVAGVGFSDGGLVPCACFNASSNRFESASPFVRSVLKDCSNAASRRAFSSARMRCASDSSMLSPDEGSLCEMMRPRFRSMTSTALQQGQMISRSDWSRADPSWPLSHHTPARLRTRCIACTLAPCTRLHPSHPPSPLRRTGRR